MSSDNFTDSNGTALATHDSEWTSIDSTYVVGNLEIQSNQLQPTAGWASYGAYYDASVEDSSELAIVAQPITSYPVRPAVRTGENNRGYSVNFNGKTGDDWVSIAIAKDGGYLGSPKAGTWDSTTSPKLKVTASGTSTTTIEVFVDDVSAGDWTDSSSPIESGHPGFWGTVDGTASNTQVDDWSDGVVSGSTLLPNKCSVAIAGYNVTVSTGEVISVSNASVSTTGLSANISAGKTISATAGSVSISGINPNISAGKIISSGVGAIVATGLQASISTGATISATIGAVSVSGVQANISAGKTIAVSVGSVVVTGANATVSNNNSINCSVGAVAVAGFNPNVSAGKTISLESGTIVSTGLPGNVSAGKTIAGSTGTVSVTGNNAEIIQSVIIEATTGAVIITGLAANISSGEIPEVPDERSFVINAENRVYSIESENRVYAIT